MNEQGEPTRAPEQADEPVALIRAGEAGVTFVQIGTSGDRKRNSAGSP